MYGYIYTHVLAVLFANEVLSALLLVLRTEMKHDDGLRDASLALSRRCVLHSNVHSECDTDQRSLTTLPFPISPHVSSSSPSSFTTHLATMANQTDPIHGDWDGLLPAIDVRKGAQFRLSAHRVLQSSIPYLLSRRAKQRGKHDVQSSNKDESTPFDCSFSNCESAQAPNMAENKLELSGVPEHQSTDRAQSVQCQTGDLTCEVPLSPEVYAEEPPVTFESAFKTATPTTSRSQDASTSSKTDAQWAADALRHARSGGADPDSGMVAAAAASRYNKNHPARPAALMNGQSSSSAKSLRAANNAQDTFGGSTHDELHPASISSNSTDFPSLPEIRSQIDELEQEYAARHPDRPLTGRIIHVSHFIPFVIRALAEVEFEKKREAKVAASATVAAMAAAARARKAAKVANEMAASQEAANGARKGSFLEGMSETTDMDKRLAENLARSKNRAGRKAWLMTPMDENAIEEGDADGKDRFTPVGSRRPSVWTEGTGVENEPRYSAVSDDNSPLRTPPAVKKVDSPPAPPPQWVLTPRRGHTALNSGIRSLCATHKQTYIGWPGDIHFAAQAMNDDRKSASQTTEEEKLQIERILASLDSPQNWAAQEIVGQGNQGNEQATRVPSPRMNGAEPIEAGNTGRTSLKARHGIRYVPVWLDDNVAHGHYEGYCKTTLWPLFHYLLWQDVPGDRKEWETFTWDAYVAANEAYAKRIAEQYKPGDLVWIHDYHLLLVPQMLRKLVPDAHIGLFVHAPFPSSEIFRCLPQRREIIEGMLGADLACFQAFSYSRHFLSSCIRVCGFEASSNSVESYNGHVTNVSYNPIGIDAEKIARDCASSGVTPKIKAIREMYKGKKIIIGRDKLDVVRGVIQKLQAFHKLLEEFPQWRDNVVLIQVTAPSMNDNPLLERQVSELVAQINGEFGSLSFTPVHHYHQIIERDEYYALLSVADLAIVSSLRDGMAASTMEFIVAQNNHAKAPLLLSEFSGSAGRLRSAIQINPWATFSSAKAIHHALVMSDQERIRRHEDLYRQVVLHTSHTWAATLVKLLVQQLLTEQSAHFTPPLDRSQLVRAHHAARKRLIMLDYDGTLTPIVRNPEAALPSKQLLEALKRLTEDERNIVYIISGRDEKFLAKHLGHLDRMGFSAEHGSFLKEPGKQWINLTRELDMSWKKDVIEIFNYYVERTAGSTVEEKKASVTWHYRNADPDYGLFQCRECQNLLDNLIAQQGLAVEVLVGKKNLECRPLAVNKGEIVKRILYSHPDAEIVFCAGDDKTDEDMFRALRLVEASGTSGNGVSAPPSCHGSPQAEIRTRDISQSPKLSRRPAAAGQSESSSPTAHASLVMSPPTPLSGSTPMGSPRSLALKPSGIFTVAIGPSGKKTLAKWHVEQVQRIIDSLSELADLADPAQDPPSDSALVEQETGEHAG